MLTYYTNGLSLPDNTLDGPERVDIHKANIAVIDGGDGTILKTVDYLIENNVPTLPILGINTGHVGFLSNDITREQAMQFLLDPDWSKLEKRMVLDVLLEDKRFTALNEVVVQPLRRGHLFTTSAKIDSEILTYKGDGLIVATPSGSTAYNLSANGPIIKADLRVIALTPICPFSLSSRTIIVPDTSKISLCSTSDVYVAIDGVTVYEGPPSRIKVVKKDFDINIVKLQPFLKAIHEKLGWNRSIK